MCQWKDTQLQNWEWCRQSSLQLIIAVGEILCVCVCRCVTQTISILPDWKALIWDELRKLIETCRPGAAYKKKNGINAYPSMHYLVFAHFPWKWNEDVFFFWAESTFLIGEFSDPSMSPGSVLSQPTLPLCTLPSICHPSPPYSTALTPSCHPPPQPSSIYWLAGDHTGDAERCNSSLCPLTTPSLAPSAPGSSGHWSCKQLSHCQFSLTSAHPLQTLISISCLHSERDRRQTTLFALCLCLHVFCLSLFSHFPAFELTP